MKKLALSVVAVSFSFAIYQDCMQCHNGIVAVDLSNFPPSYIIKKMKEFKAGRAGSLTMINIAQEMSMKEIIYVAHKYGKKVSKKKKK